MFGRPIRNECMFGRSDALAQNKHGSCDKPRSTEAPCTSTRIKHANTKFVLSQVTWLILTFSWVRLWKLSHFSRVIMDIRNGIGLAFLWIRSALELSVLIAVERMAYIYACSKLSTAFNLTFAIAKPWAINTVFNFCFRTDYAEKRYFV